jgi:polar amino acid transport system substrate-binding protein
MSDMVLVKGAPSQIVFSDPYLVNGQVIIVRTRDRVITNPASLKGKKVGVIAGSASETYAKTLKAGATAPATVQLYDSQAKYYTDLKAGTINAVITDSISGSWYLKHNTGFKIVGSQLTQENIVVGIRKNNTALTTAINRAIVSLKADPGYPTILNRWYQ